MPACVRARPAVLAPLLLLAPLAAAAAGARLETTSVPAAGRHPVVVTVETTGRYALTARSAQGVRLQLVDRMAGPRDASGEPGASDGRIDAVLDAGESLLVVEGAQGATGEAQLAVEPFEELNAPAPPELLDARLVTARLADLQQASFWVRVPERGPVMLEAAGRHLADMRLWRDGSWLVDAAPGHDVVEPVPGEPLRRLRLAPVLEPGTYLLVAYGGPGETWSTPSSATPLLVRRGLPRAPSAVRRRVTVGPLGEASWLTPASVDYFRVELAEAKPAAITVREHQPEWPWPGAGDARGEITKESVVPVAELFLPAGAPQAWRRVTVTAAPGEPVLVQHFEDASSRPIQGRGPYLVGTVPSGHAEDSVDATGVLWHHAGDGSARIETVASQAVPVGRDRAWSRRFNLLEPASVILDVADEGRYELSLSGVRASGMIEPWMLWPPERYEPPRPLSGTSSWDLAPGLWRVTFLPEEIGIVEASVRHDGGVIESLGDLVAGGDAGSPLRPAIRLDRVELAAGRDYMLSLNQQPGVRQGLLARTLPIDLREPLPLALAAGEEVALPVREDRAGDVRLRLETDAPSSDVSGALDGAPIEGETAIAAGPHELRLRNAGARAAFVTVVAEPASARDDAPLPPLPEVPPPPELPVLREDVPTAIDLPRDGSATFLVEAREPGLYRLESTGLLDVEGNLRSRTVPSLFRDQGSGTGRNFLVQQFLREGTYQLTVSARGLSAGRVGLRLSRTPVADGGELASGSAARETLEAGSAVAYSLRPAGDGPHAIRAAGQGRVLRCRVEDEDGWPLVTPGQPCDLRVDLVGADPVRLIVLPEPVDVRVATSFAAEEEPLAFTGHGPHDLPLGVTVEHEWLEPGEGEPRDPDTWRFDLPAPADVRIVLGGEMHGTLRRAGTVVAELPPGRGWSGRLDAGAHVLEATSQRRDHRARYRVGVHPAPLLPGMERVVSAPIDVPLAVGRSGQVELRSRGDADVRASLLGADGALIARSDDAPDDWNFRMAPILAPGGYVLRVEPVGVRSALTTVSLSQPEERAGEPLSAGEARALRLDGALHVLEATGVPEGALLVATARGADAVGLAVDVLHDGAWVEAGTHVHRRARVLVPAGADALRLRVWPAGDRRDVRAEIAVEAATPACVPESQLERGLLLARVDGTDTGVACVDLDGPGALRVDATARVLAGSEPGTALARHDEGLLVATTSRLWLADGASRRPIAASRARLEPGAPPERLTVPATGVATIDLDARAGLVVVRASSPVGTPGVGIAVDDEPATRLLHQVLDVAPGVAVTAATDVDGGVLHVWNSREDRAIPVELRIFAFDPPMPETLESDAHAPASVDSARDIELRGGEAASFSTPAQLVKLALEPGLVVLARSAGRDVVVAAHDRSLTHEVDGPATVTIAATAPGRAHASISPVAVTWHASGRLVRPGQPHESRHAHAGILRLTVAPAPGSTLRVLGSTEAPVLVTESGRVSIGTSSPLTDEHAELRVAHGAGLVVASIEPPDAQQVASSTPCRIADCICLGRIRYWVQDPQPRSSHIVTGVECPFPVLASVRSPQPGFTHGSGSHGQHHLERVVVDAWLPTGQAMLWLRGMAGDALTAPIDIAVTEPVPAREGFGPEVLLGAGEARAFTFDVQRASRLGVGVRATSDRVEGTLVDPTGRELGRGLVQVLDLEPGLHALIVRAPGDSAPVRVQPIVIGLDPPPDAPPPEVVRAYVEGTEPPPLPAAPDGTPPDDEPPRVDGTGEDAHDEAMEAEAATEDHEGEEGP